MRKETALDILFDAFVEQEAWNKSKPFAEMEREFEKSAMLLKSNDLDEEELCFLKYLSMKAGFFAGAQAMKSVIINTETDLR